MLFTVGKPEERSQKPYGNLGNHREVCGNTLNPTETTDGIREPIKTTNHGKPKKPKEHETALLQFDGNTPKTPHGNNTN